MDNKLIGCWVSAELSFWAYNFLHDGKGFYSFFDAKKEFTYTENGAKLTIDSEKEKFIVLTIPYDKGWTITNNKQKIAYENVDNGLIGITVSEGKNNIEMIYKTPGLKLSIIISIISIISLSTYLLLIKTKRLVL